MASQPKAPSSKPLKPVRVRTGGWAPIQLAPTRVVLALLGILIVFPWVVPGGYWVRVISLVGIYVMLAIGLNVVVGFAGLLDLGYIAFFGIGSYTYALLSSPQLNIHLPFWLALPIVVILVSICGILIGYPTLCLRGDYIAIVTLAFGEIVYLLMINLDRPINITNGVNGILNIDPPQIYTYTVGNPIAIGRFELTGPTQFYYLILLAVVGSVVFARRLNNSRLGRAWSAIREDETVAATMGINLVRSKLLAYALGGSTAGVAGVLSAAWSGSVFPDSFLLYESILVLVMVVLGGMGSIPGVILGASALILIPELLREFQIYRTFVFGLVLIVMVIFRPEGLLPSARRRAELHQAEVSPPGPLPELVEPRLEEG